MEYINKYYNPKTRRTVSAYASDVRWKEVTRLVKKAKFAKANELQLRIWRDHGKPSYPWQY